MSRIAPKLLTALFVLGCGSGAMASPNRGQWTGQLGQRSEPVVARLCPRREEARPRVIRLRVATSPRAATRPRRPGSGGSTFELIHRRAARHQAVPGSGIGAAPGSGSGTRTSAETEPVEGQGKLGIMVNQCDPRAAPVLRRRRRIAWCWSPGSSPARRPARAGIQVGDVLVRVGGAGWSTPRRCGPGARSRARAGGSGFAVVRQGSPRSTWSPSYRPA